MMENDEMIYTTIFQNKEGKLRRDRYLGSMSRKEAWLAASEVGHANGECLIAIVPGDHPVYTYEEVVVRQERSDIKNHDLYDMSDEKVFQMT
mgnify:FL=1